MIIKAVLLFLVGMLLLGMTGRFRRSGKRRDDGNALLPAQKCQACGTYVMGRDPAPCSRSDCPYL